MQYSFKRYQQIDSKINVLSNTKNKRDKNSYRKSTK